MRNYLRFFGAALIACAMTLTIACDSGVVSPAAPSATGASAPTSSSAATLTAQARDGGRVVATLSEADSSGVSGQCTVQRNRTNGRFKMNGEGATPSAVLGELAQVGLFWPTGQRVVSVEVNSRGVFRRGWAEAGFYGEGSPLHCRVLEKGVVVAQSDVAGFEAP